jgi:putative ABC transport system permease protein
MAGHNFKLALRHMWKHKSHVFINTLGLAIGIAFFIMIGLFVIHELSYDKFNEKKDRICRLILDGKIGEQEILGSFTPAPMAAALKEEIPEIIEACRMDNWGETVIRYEDKTYIEDHFVLADSTFFNIFSIPLIKGNPQQALNAPHKVVLTESSAAKYFGNEDPIGKMLLIGTDTTQYSVTGICKDLPDNSHFEFNMLGSFLTHWRASEEIWLSNSFATYVLLTEGASPKDVEEKIKPILLKNIGPELQQIMGISIEDFQASGDRYGISLQPLTDIHLNPAIETQFKQPNDKKYIYIFALVAIAILIIAVINYMNLATAQSAGRAHEVGLKKVMGSGKYELIWQFLVESVIFSLLSLVIALLLIELLLPYFNNLVQLKLDLAYFDKWYIIPLLLALSLAVGIASGTYPAFFLSSFRPSAVLSGKLRSGLKSGILRSILVVFQLTISITLIVATIVIFRQVHYMLNKDLGFNKEQVMVIEQVHALQDKIPVFKKEIENIPGVVACSHSTAVPGHMNNVNGYMIEGRGEDNVVIMTTTWTDYDHLKTYGIELVEGRFLSEEFTSDSTACVINETAVKNFQLEDPLNTRFILPTPFGSHRIIQNVVGVVKDFHFTSLREGINPFVFLNAGNQQNWGYFSIKIRPENVSKTTAQVEKVWKDFTNDYPIQYFFMDEDFNRQYQEDQRTGRLSLVFGILAIFIASLGLYGLTSFTVEQRTKEIGIRKIQGANISRIVYLMLKESTIMIVISTVIAWVLAFLYLTKWLENYSYRIKLSPADFIISLIIVLVISWLTISYWTIKAARTNPADALRYE